MTRFSICLALACGVGCQHVSPRVTTVTPDPELQRLTADLNAADSQTDMNIASGKIAEFWEAKLASLEKRISQTLAVDQQKQFLDCKEQWIGYRTLEVCFCSDFFEGGSIQPLVANETYSEITEQRVAELESVAEGIVGKQ